MYSINNNAWFLNGASRLVRYKFLWMDHFEDRSLATVNKN